LPTPTASTPTLARSTWRQSAPIFVVDTHAGSSAASLQSMRMTPDDEDTAAARPRRRRDTSPLLRSAVLVCSEGAETTGGLARLREIAWERELYVECVTFDPEGTERLVVARPHAVFVAPADDPPASLDVLRAACSRTGSILVLVGTETERSIRAAVASIEDAIIGHLDERPPEKAKA
jgi:hypothetical protein